MSAIFTKPLEHGKFETWSTKPPFDFHQVKQVHGTDISTLANLPCEADGMIVSWDEFNQPLMIKTADCMPIIFEGKKGIVFLHAGWRGLANGILKRPELSLIFPQRVFIGPSIQSCCFEVSSDFQNNFNSSPHFSEKDGKLYFHLQQEAKIQLEEMYPSLRVEMTPECTCCNTKYHSYRSDKTTKRNWNLYIKG